MKSNTDCIPNLLHCLFTAKQNGRVIAHCLDFDLVAGAPSSDEAEARLEALIKAFVEGTIHDANFMALSHKAPTSFWEEFQDAWRNGRHV